MIEKVLFLLFTSLVAVVGYFIKKTLDGIEAKQGEHTKSLRVTSDRVVRLEERQAFVEKQVLKIEEKIDSSSALGRTLQDKFDANLEHMRTEVSVMKKVQEDQGQNFGKVFMIVQKLYTQLVAQKKSN